MRHLFIVCCLISSLYSGEAIGGVHQLADAFGGMSFSQDQVDQLSGLLGGLSMHQSSQTTQLIALLIKTMAYDSQPQSNGLAMAQLIACHSKKMRGEPLEPIDRIKFSSYLKTGEPHQPRKKMAEEMLFALMIGRGKSLPEGWRETAGKDQTDVFDQLEAWRETSCGDLAELLPSLPLENMFSQAGALEVAPMDIE